MADEQAAGDSAADAREAINSILDRLDGLFANGTVRLLSGDPLADPRTADAQQWQPRVEVIRAWSRGESARWRHTGGFKAAISCAEQLKLLLPGENQELSGKIPAAVYSAVDQLNELIASIVPRECDCCHKRFTSDRPDVTWCHDCRTGRGRLFEVDVALDCWWKRKHPIPTKLGNSTEWHDLREAVYDRFGVLLGDNGNPWNEADVCRQRETWEKVWLALRKHKMPSMGEAAWREELLGKPIGGVAAQLGGGEGLIGKSLRHPGAKAELDAMTPAWMKLPASLPPEPLAGANLDFLWADRPATPAGEDQPSHGPDFRSVRWFGATYSFTPNQAACVGLLWESWERGSPDIGGATLLQAAGVDSERLDHVFRGCPAWGKMIVSGATKGSHRLQESPKPARTPRGKKSGRGAK